VRIYGNRELKTLDGRLTRPTSAKVRQALFNIWQNAIADCRWLDLCAGNGSLGAEALCRGGREAVAIERSGKACQIIRLNWQKVAQETQKITIIRGDVLTKLSQLKGEVFDRIYFDPPYQSQLYEPVLKAIAEYNLLSKEGELAVEHDPRHWTAVSCPGLTICRTKRYGNTSLTFYENSS
jgi:16S rRNA (guanine966-N2)-methyltransferase